ncbi:MAG: ATP-dependent Clp protease proteolytic subunit [Candidatus Zixiibacteriota bacterium]
MSGKIQKPQNFSKISGKSDFTARSIYVQGEITDQMSRQVISAMLRFETNDHSRDIHMYIDSAGGDVKAGLAIYNTMQYISSDISTICLSKASSMAALLLASGTPGKRIAAVDARIRIHEPWPGRHDSHYDRGDKAIIEMMHIQHILNEILHRHTSLPLSVIQTPDFRNCSLSAAEARAIGLIDIIRH